MGLLRFPFILMLSLLILGLVSIDYLQTQVGSKAPMFITSTLDGKRIAVRMSPDPQGAEEPAHGDFQHLIQVPDIFTLEMGEGAEGPEHKRPSQRLNHRMGGSSSGEN